MPKRHVRMSGRGSLRGAMQGAISEDWKVNGLKGLRKRLSRLDKDMQNTVRVEVEKGLKALRNDARRNIKATRTMRTRTLWRNILYIMDLDGFGGTVGAYNEGYYGHLLEFGTRSGVDKKPWLYPAYKKHKRLFTRRLYRALRKVAREAGK